MTLPVALYDNDQIRLIEQRILQSQQLTVYALMCRAGEAVFQACQQTWPENRTLTFLIGTGNNGGDGLVVARLAKAQGLSVLVYQVGEHKPEHASDAAKQARADWLATGGTIIPFTPEAKAQGVIVDALLGTGIKGAVAAPFAQAISWINHAGLPVISVDLPSGVDSNTGQAMNAVHAHVTVVLIALKVGLMTGVAYDYRGELIFDDLGFSPELYTEIPSVAQRIAYEVLIHQLPPRRPSTHKGDNGHVCVIGGGSGGFSGAVLLAGESALHAGAGLVSIAAAPEAIPLLARGPMELMCHGIPDPQSLAALLEKATVLVLGPGLGQSTWSEHIFAQALSTQKPCVVDADGLNLLALHPQKRSNWILTPHPKEAARLLNTTVANIQADRMAAAQALVDQYGGVAVLKGAGTVVAAADQPLSIACDSLPILATGGTGDVLAGLIGGLLAQGLPAHFAAQLGVSVHCNAAQIESALGDRGMLASDLFLHIRGLLSPSSSS